MNIRVNAFDECDVSSLSRHHNLNPTIYFIGLGSLGIGMSSTIEVSTNSMGLSAPKRKVHSSRTAGESLLFYHVIDCLQRALINCFFYNGLTVKCSPSIELLACVDRFSKGVRVLRSGCDRTKPIMVGLGALLMSLLDFHTFGVEVRLLVSFMSHKKFG